MNEEGVTAVLLLSCPDQKGLVAAVSDFLYRNNGNIIHADQHTDQEEGIFFLTGQTCEEIWRARFQ